MDTESKETKESKGGVWRAEVSAVIVARSQQEAETLFDLRCDEGPWWFFQGGSLSAMDEADVIPGSPVAEALAALPALDVFILGEGQGFRFPDVAELQSMVSLHEQKGAGLRRLVAGINAYNNSDAPAVTTPAAMLDLMREGPERLWRLVDIRRDLLARGWARSPKAVDAAAKRLLQQGLIEKAEYGVYRLPASTTSISDASQKGSENRD